MQALLPEIVGDKLSETGISIHQEYRYLAILMGLPLIDGVFISVVLTGGLNSVLDSILVGSLVLGGCTIVAVIFSEFNSNKYDSIKRILVFSTLIGFMASIQATIAPSFNQALNTETLSYGAFVALLIMSIKIYPNKNTDILPSPISIILISTLLSFDFLYIMSGPDLIYSIENTFYALLATCISAFICITAVICKPYIRNKINIKFLKYGASIGLIIIAIDIVDITQSTMTSLSIIFAFVFCTAICYLKITNFYETSNIL